jgi:hypothetical protein
MTPTIATVRPILFMIFLLVRSSMPLLIFFTNNERVGIVAETFQSQKRDYYRSEGQNARNRTSKGVTASAK